MSRAYYNEHDRNAAQWLRELIAAGHIAPGDVDERSIEDVRPTDLVGYDQCHFFAGIGVWSYALRLAGWPDDRPVWTGSCPCQPFSTAGKGEGLADERHLWPAWFHLIEHGKPEGVPILGEQVANGGGLAWLDLVHADLAGAGYTFRPVDLCAAGVGAPHIRQRLFFHAIRDSSALAHANGEGGLAGLRDREQGGLWRPQSADHGGLVGMAHDGHGERVGRHTVRGAAVEPSSPTGADEKSGQGWIVQAGQRPGDDASVRGPGDGVADDHGGRCEPLSEPRLHHAQPNVEPRSNAHDQRPGPVNGRWAAADWIFCRDGNWRPVEPGTQPLVNGAPARVVRLRGYGNGIVAQLAAEFIKAVM